MKGTRQWIIKSVETLAGKYLMCHRMEVCCILYKGEDKGKSSAEQHLSSREVHLQFYNTEGSVKLPWSQPPPKTRFIALFIALFYCSCIIYNFLVCYLYCSIVLLLLLVFINYTHNLYFANWSFLVRLLAFCSLCILLVCLSNVFKAIVNISSHRGAAGSSLRP